MNIRLSFVLFVLLACGPTAFAQPTVSDKASWCKLRKQADRMVREMRFAEAADLYSQAAAKKPQKTELTYKAGENYYKSQQFDKSIARLSAIQNNPKFPQAGLMLARSYKQTGQYESAYKAYAAYIAQYKGADAEAVSAQVQREMRGCELGMALLRQPDTTRILTLLERGVNSPAKDFAPIPFGDGVLYYSSTRKGLARIYRSQLANGRWSEGEVPAGFPDLGDKHFANGCFSADGQRFYFTQCENVATNNGIGAQCQIYVLLRQSGVWSAPQRLPDYINQLNATTTQPFLTLVGDQEILFFSSNRQGGFGGMDIWYATREAAGSQFDFSMPRNCGAQINTPLDELTPFYDIAENRLYFSSEGHIGIGGLDIYYSDSQSSDFGPAQHLGSLYNSPNDDFYFRTTERGDVAYFASNRIAPPDKTTTTDVDIFSIQQKRKTFYVSGVVSAGFGQPTVRDVRLSLYEVLNNDTKRLLQTFIAEDGNYKFELLEGKKYRIEATKDGFFTSVYEVTADRENQRLPIYMDSSSPTPKPPTPTPAPKPSTPAPNPSPKPNKPTPNPKPDTPPPATTASPRTMQPADGSEPLKTDAPIKPGTYYKVQIQAVKSLDAPNARFTEASAIARVDYEYIASKDLYRMLLGDYPNFDMAQIAVQKAEAAGFKGAFIVRYENGIRIKNGK